MKIYDYLKKDHRKVSNLFNKILKAKTNITRGKFQKQIITELLIHAVTEQKTFYKKLKEYDFTEKCTKHATKEHRDIANHIKKLAREDIGTKSWLAAVKELKKTVQHHVREEEGPMFRQAKQVLTDREAQALTRRMARMKVQAKKQLKLSSPLLIKKPAVSRRSRKKAISIRSRTKMILRKAG